jgi:hypothetical protein
MRSRYAARSEGWQYIELVEELVGKHVVRKVTWLR